VDNHFPGKNPIELIEDLDLVTVQMRIIGCEGSPANALSREGTEGFPQLGIKLKVLD
jgi:hypothetical protein